jgi:pimeloyl-ACP methyl ester carboxylesterase
MRTRPPSVLALAIVLAACGGTPSPSATPEPTVGPSVADIAVEGDRTLHIVCVGSSDAGRPTVVFENGAGPSLGTWSSVMDDIKTTHRSCAYDRAGIGQSDRPTAARTTRDQVSDLAALLSAAGVTGPLVLVAHSRGGWNAIVYTADHPDQVVGAVLVDIMPPGLDARWLEELPPETPDEPETIREAREDFTSALTDQSMDPEKLDVAKSEEQVLGAPGLGARPTEILWATDTQATVWPGFDPDLAARLNLAFEGLRLDVEGLADDPRVTRVDSDHSIHEEQPEVVIAAIRRVLAQLEP